MADFGQHSAVELYPEPGASLTACHVVARPICFGTDVIASLVRVVGLVAISPMEAVNPCFCQVPITNVAKRSDEGPSGIADP